jgi:2-polyprenyl-3-methyl-5-hydroxy-6-metoxy-1,4-benzoquinol methylase
MMISAQEIEAMSYTDFVGYLNQWNVPPGSYDTLSRWITFGGVAEKSNVLEVACTTGFSLREIARMTHCSGHGFDLSQPSIETARKNKEKFIPNLPVDFECIDGYSFQPKATYSHIIVGAALRFFPDPEKMLQRCITFFSDGGILLASEFFVHKNIPSEVIERAKKVFNFTPTQTGYKDVMRIYQGFEIMYEERKEIMQETDEELANYCHSTIERCFIERGLSDETIKPVLFNRLMEIKRMSNELREYQSYAVLVMRYRKDIYPNRYVELF